MESAKGLLRRELCRDFFSSSLEPIYTFKTNPGKPAIYSPRVVLVFSMLFSALAGGILTFYSLRAARQPVAAQRALWASFGYIVMLVALFILLPFLRAGGKGLSVGLGYAGGYLLNHFFLQKYLPDEATYPRKGWVKPLLIWVVVLGVGLGGLALILEGEGA